MEEPRIVGLKGLEQAIPKSESHCCISKKYNVQLTCVRPAPTGFDGQGTLQDAVRGAFHFLPHTNSFLPDHVESP